MPPTRSRLATLLGLLIATLAAPAPVRAQGTPPKPDTAPLARYLPKTDHLLFLAEFDGLDAHADAWKATAAYKILNETSTGAMLEELFTQLIDQAGQGNGPSGADSLAMIKFLARNGALIAAWSDPSKPGDDHALFVFRGAARKENRPIAAKLLGSLMGQGAKTQKTVKAGRTIVEVVPTAGPKTAWWTEKDSDLVYLAHVEDVDAVLATIDGTAPNAIDSPQRAVLYETDGSFAPIGGAMMDFERIKQSVPKAAQDLKDVPIQRLDFRWGFDGPAIMSVSRLDAPAPRTGGWSLIDQPPFDFRALPPIPSGVDGFTAFSIDLDKTYDQITTLARQANPQAGEQIADFEKLVQEKTRRKLREDFLAPLGPKMAFYLPPGKPAASNRSPGAAPGGNNPLAAMASTGLQVPKAVLIVEANDPARFSKALDELMIFVNKQLESQFAERGGGPQTKGATGKAARKPAGATAPKFQMTPSAPGAPKTYVLRLPTQLAAMTNLNLTVAMGQKHLVIASASDAARDALALETKTEGRWVPQGDLAQSLSRLPEGRLILLRVNDPTQTLPDALATLPQTATAVSAVMAQAAKGQMPGLPGMTAPPGGGPPGAAPPGAPAGVDNEFAARKSASSGTNINRRKLGITGSDAPAPERNDPSNAPATTANQPGAAPSIAGTFTLKLDPAKAPRADQIRPLLFPGSTALAVEERGARLVTRSSFPDVASPSGAASTGVLTALLLPAVQKAREAARNAAARNAAGQAAVAAGSGEAAVGPYVIKVPPGFNPQEIPTLPPAPPGTSTQVKAWSSPKDPNDGTATVLVVTIFTSPTDLSGQLDDFLRGFIDASKRQQAAQGLTDFSEDGRSTVELGGRKFTKLIYSAGPSPDRHVLRCVAYIAVDGRDVATIAGGCPDGQQPAMTAALEAVAASLRRGDAPGAAAAQP